ncbi:3-hydroxyacyl-CoA dehydrogenase NAD-binding domain-containing protein [Streptomyces platensis]|uniref:3-hydroxyacyl-CoA dehydrogenase NAD-binding domain-containing protein n=1 Tax=Streptomyces platensis TaxID=58346 RepID=UPI003682F2EE
MSESAVERVGVVGCGLMGSGIAEVCARAGREVRVVETGTAAAEAGLRRISGSVERAGAAGELSVRDRDAALARITVTTDLATLADRDLVIEAVAEDEAAKLAVFTRLDEVSGAASADVAKAERTLETRERILSAACEVIAEVGFEKIRMRMVAEHAGVSTALLHYHFENVSGSSPRR